MSYNLPDDKLNRKDEVLFLQNYLTNRYELKKDESFVLNINAEWGYGKTYFLKSMKQELEKNHKVIYFDAWKNDFTKEPLLAFIATMTEELEEYFNSTDENIKSFFKVTIKNSLPLLVSILAKQLTGRVLEDLKDSFSEKEESTENIESDNDIEVAVSSLMSKATEIALKEHNNTRSGIEDFVINMKSLLQTISENKKLPLFILIDELDRCRPNYAIELLESIKHLFDIPGIVFIVATDSKQLAHSINAVYGEKFASAKYLKRFFDQEYTLKEPDKYEYCKYLFEMEIPNSDKLFNPLRQYIYPDEDLNVVLFKIYAEYFNLGLRDIKQCVNLLQTVILTWDKEEQIHLAYLLFFIMLKQVNIDLKNYEFEVASVNIGDFFNQLSKNKIINENIQLYKSRNTNATKEEKFKIIDLILFYKKVSLFSNQREIIDLSNAINRNVIKDNIVHSFFNNRNYELLKNYPNLVLNAGQLE